MHCVAWPISGCACEDVRVLCVGKEAAAYTDLGPMIRRVVQAFGPRRLMWASDCPYQVQGGHDYDSSIALIRDHIDFLSAADKEQILRSTAERVFFEK